MPGMPPTEAQAQAMGDAGHRIPVVAHKRNRGSWLVTLRGDDLFKLLAQAQLGKDLSRGGVANDI